MHPRCPCKLPNAIWFVFRSIKEQIQSNIFWTYSASCDGSWDEWLWETNIWNLLWLTSLARPNRQKQKLLSRLLTVSRVTLSVCCDTAEKLVNTFKFHHPEAICGFQMVQNKKYIYINEYNTYTYIYSVYIYIQCIHIYTVYLYIHIYIYTCWILVPWKERRFHTTIQSECST